MKPSFTGPAAKKKKEEKVEGKKQSKQGKH
jgi:hypothetical protein